ncbi:glycerol-3-phosphate acyltransferase [Pseudonocardia endophytica]|uniref:Glycerol-3-phosphate acyltransferase n=1 Tax=Pseudonocardia endophytica TaxID=401976 RepID=A0A4R1HLW3_PSEEN|nr:glycerol-3-phosphate acyltransferase [Pseudonocardia endophytica]
MVLSSARSGTERMLLRTWVSEHFPSAEMIQLGSRSEPPSALERSLDGDATLVVPVRVTWVPPEDDDAGPVRSMAGLATGAVMRNAWWRLHPQLARHRPEAAQVVAGEPATVADLMSRFAAQVQDRSGSSAFARFVVRQAVLACDRAERRVLGDRYKVPRRMVEQITSSSRFSELVGRLVGETGTPRDEVERRLRRSFHEMAAVQSPPAIDVFRAMMGPLHAKAWDVHVDESGLERLRELNKEHALVFLPSHRSYSDPLLFAEVLHERNFPRNHVLGGNNLSFWPMGALGRRAGIVFIRRSFGGDTVYKAAMQEYLGHLLSKRFNLEWYIEGGRSRTGKLRRPRYGLLRYLAAALQDRPGLDAVLVPVSIVYDQLHEVGAMAAEQRGAAKKSEGLGWLAGYFRDQRRHIGTARVRFAEPISFRQALEESGDGSAQLEKIAFRVCVGINKVSAATATSLATFALLTARDRALTLQQVRDVVAPLADYLDARGVPVPVAELRTRHGLRMTLDQLAEARVVEIYSGGTEPVFSIARGRHHVAAFYRNGALHHLLNRALTEVALLRVGDMPDGTPGEELAERAWDELNRLRDLLKFEFFFSDRKALREEVFGEFELMDADWRLGGRQPAELATQAGRGETSPARPADARAILRRVPLLVAPGTLRSFLDAQLVVAEQLAEMGEAPMTDEKAFLETCLGVGRQMLLQHRLDRADSVSRELYATALRLAENRNLVAPDGDADVLVAGRRAWQEELTSLIDDMGRLARLERARLEVVLGGAGDSPDGAGETAEGSSGVAS